MCKFNLHISKLHKTRVKVGGEKEKKLRGHVEVMPPHLSSGDVLTPSFSSWIDSNMSGLLSAV